MSEPPRRLFRRSTPTLQEQRRQAELAAAGRYGHDENVHPTANPPATPPKRPLQSSPSSRHATSPSLSEACHGAASPSLSEACHGAASPSLSACHGAASPSLSEVCHGAASPSLSEVCHGAASPSLSEACHGAASPLPFCASKRPSPLSFGASTRLSQQRTRVIEYEEEATPAPDASHESGDRSSDDDGRRARAAVAAAQLEDPRAALQHGHKAKCPLGSARARLLLRLFRAHLTALAGPALTPKREPSPLGRRTEPALAFTSGALPYKVADSTASDHPGPAASERRLKRRKVYGFTVAAGPAAAVSLVTWLGLG